MLWVVLGELSPAVAQLQGWLEQTGAGEYAGMLLKSLGICYLAQLAADSCRDAGQSAIASKIILEPGWQCCCWHCLCLKKSLLSAWA